MTAAKELQALAERKAHEWPWRPIETAPKDGTHILVGDFRIDAVGFGWFSGKHYFWMAVAHYWAHPGEEGFYLSSGASAECDDRPLTNATHWMPLPKPLGTGFAGGGV